MAIEVVFDGSPRWEPAEQCCFCYRRTRFWYAKKDVACCPDCALFKTDKDVPSKKVWWEAVEARQKEQEQAHWAAMREKNELERLRTFHAAATLEVRPSAS
jgi:hypothetical protein